MATIMVLAKYLSRQMMTTSTQSEPMSRSFVASL